MRHTGGRLMQFASRLSLKPAKQIVVTDPPDAWVRSSEER